VLVPTAYAVDPVAAYTFDNTLAAIEPGVAPLTAVNPLGTSEYQPANVFGNNQVIYHFDGSANPPSDQGGLDFNATGLISSNDYSVEMVFELAGSSGYRRLLDSLDRNPTMVFTSIRRTTWLIFRTADTAVRSRPILFSTYSSRWTRPIM
jgi:hypothetical protein